MQYLTILSDYGGPDSEWAPLANYWGAGPLTPYDWRPCKLPLMKFKKIP